MPDKLQEFVRQSIDQLLASLPADELRKRLSTEERLKGLPAEERLKGLPAEELRKRLSTEERLKGLTADEVVKALPPRNKQAMELSRQAGDGEVLLSKAVSTDPHVAAWVHGRRISK